MEDSQKTEKTEKEKMFDIAMSVLDGTFDIKEYYNLTDGGAEAIYAAGYEFFRYKKYEQAQQIFALLCFIDNKCAKYSYAYGAASFMLKRYYEAEISYRCALLLGDYSPNLFMRLAEACLAQQKMKEPTECLNEVILLVESGDFSDEESKHIAGRAFVILNGLNERAERAEEAR
jgi:tetratricopeptide (TPR) repeat protein